MPKPPASSQQGSPARLIRATGNRYSPDMSGRRISFPVPVERFAPMNNGRIRVILVDGTESRIIGNRRRGLIVPRRWRKPRNV